MTTMQQQVAWVLESANRASNEGTLEELDRGLRNHRLLGQLRHDELTSLLRSSTWVNVSPGEFVAIQGAPVDSVLFIAEGCAREEIAAPEKPAYRAVVGFLGPGDEVGLLSLVDRAPHQCSVVVVRQLRALKVPTSVAESCLEAHGEWYRPIAEAAVSRLQSSGLWLQSLL